MKIKNNKNKIKQNKNKIKKKKIAGRGGAEAGGSL